MVENIVRASLWLAVSILVMIMGVFFSSVMMYVGIGMSAVAVLSGIDRIIDVIFRGRR